MKCPKCEHEFEPTEPEVEALVIDGLEEIRKWFENHAYGGTHTGPTGPPEPNDK